MSVGEEVRNVWYCHYAVSDLVQQTQTGVSATEFQWLPVKVCQHVCDTRRVVMAVGYPSGCSSLHLLDGLFLFGDMWVPCCSCIF